MYPCLLVANVAVVEGNPQETRILFLWHFGSGMVMGDYDFKETELIFLRNVFWELGRDSETTTGPGIWTRV